MGHNNRVKVPGMSYYYFLGGQLSVEMRNDKGHFENHSNYKHPSQLSTLLYDDLHECTTEKNVGHKPMMMMMTSKRLIITVVLTCTITSCFMSLHFIQSSWSINNWTYSQEVEEQQQKLSFTALRQHDEDTTNSRTVIGGQEEYEEKIKYALGLVTQMSETLEQLLILARLDSSEAMHEKQVSPLTEIVEQSLALYSQTIAEKSIRINFEVKEEIEFLAPYYYTSLILQNLIQNAVKYSFYQGVIEISITQLEHVICLSVLDYGIGIKQEDHVNVFNNFFRSEAMNHKQIPGNGLGLSIVKKCVEAIKAEIVLKSEIGKGTRIDVLFKHQ
jgi:signal transduction histidine kinase